jgi:hypothetical protein
MTFTASPTRLAERLGAIVGEVIVRVMSRVRFTTELSHPAAVAQIVAAWLARRRAMILALMARIQAGKPPSPRPSRSFPVKQGAVRAPKPKLPPELRLKRGFGWLCGLADEVRDQGVWLRELLAEAEMRDLVLATPRMARLLSPLLHALGELKPDWMVAGAVPSHSAMPSGAVPAPHPPPPLTPTPTLPHQGGRGRKSLPPRLWLRRCLMASRWRRIFIGRWIRGCRSGPRF